MVNSFLSSLTNRFSTPLDSLHITYISIAHGGLGLILDTHTRSVPDFSLTMGQPTCYAEEDFSLDAKEPALMLPSSLRNIFRGHTNKTSHFL